MISSTKPAHDWTPPVQPGGRRPIPGPLFIALGTAGPGSFTAALSCELSVLSRRLVAADEGDP